MKWLHNLVDRIHEMYIVVMIIRTVETMGNQMNRKKNNVRKIENAVRQRTSAISLSSYDTQTV